MQINKSKRSASKHSPNTSIDGDFASIFYVSKGDKIFGVLKPILKVSAVVALLIGIIYGSVLLFGFGNNEDTYSTSLPQTKESTTRPQNVKDTPQPAEKSAPATVAPSQTSSTSNDTTAPSEGRNYDPSKCDPLSSEATRLRQAADQKKTTYDNTFAARKNYGYYYDQYGNSTDAQKAYDAQEARLDQLQTDWQSALDKANTAYSKYQECRANL